MTWARLDDGFHDDPKILGVDLAAVGLFAVSLTHAGRQLTDGHVSHAVAQHLSRGNAALIAQLVAANLWEEQPDGYLIRNYLCFNPKAKEVKRKRKEAKDRMRALRIRSREQAKNKRECSREQVNTGCLGDGPGREYSNKSSSDTPIPSPPSLAVSSDAALDGMFQSPVPWPSCWPEGFDPLTRPLLAETARVHSPKCTDVAKAFAKFRAWALSEGVRTARWDQRWARWAMEHDQRPCPCGASPAGRPRGPAVDEETRAAAQRGMDLVLGRRRAEGGANG